MQRERNFRPWITGIASGQRTYGIDPKVLRSVALRDVAGASEKPGRRPRKNLLLLDIYSPAGVAYLEGFLALLGGADDMRLDGIRRWEGGTWSM